MVSRILRTLCAFVIPAALAGIAIALYARFIEPKRLQVTELDLSSGDDPLTIAFVTDTHVGPHFSGDDLAPTVRALQTLQPDILLFGGDFISESPRFLRELETPLKQMTATARLNSWGIWGNHDVANIRSRLAPVLEQCGVRMLTNEAVHIRDDLWIVGIDDVLLGESDIPAAFATVPDGSRVIALWHEPDKAERLVPYRPIIMLSGHTHGGQARLPLIGALATPSLGERYVAGSFDVQGMRLYVSRGIGMYRPPVRFHCRPELVVISVD